MGDSATLSRTRPAAAAVDRTVDDRAVADRLDTGEPPWRVARSAIHGRGLFATRRIRKGELIGRLEGKPTRRDGAYVLWLTDTEGFRVTNAMRFINHSDNPNAAYYDDLEVVAVRAIEPGEEITHDYSGQTG